MSNAVQTITSAIPEEQLAALQKSRLSDLIEDKGLFARVCEAAVMLLNSDKLRACDEPSILGALYKAASMGFRLEPEFGECYLIPRSIKVGGSWVPTCCFQIGYKGWKAMAMQTGLVSFLEAREVYAEDEFSFEYGSSAFWKHIPAEKNEGATTHFYASAKLSDGNTAFDVMNKQGAEKSRRNSESQYDWVGTGGNKQKQYSEKPKDIWAKHYAAMALRVPVKKVCAMLPLTPAIEAATKADGSITYLQKDGTLTTISPVDVEDRAEKINAADLSKISPDQADAYLNIKDSIGSIDDFGRLLDAWEMFNESEQNESFPFAQVYFEQVAKLATTAAELGAFYNSAKRWHKTPDLIKILSNRKLKIEADAKL